MGFNVRMHIVPYRSKGFYSNLTKNCLLLRKQKLICSITSLLHWHYVKYMPCWKTNNTWTSKENGKTHTHELESKKYHGSGISCWFPDLDCLSSYYAPNITNTPINSFLFMNTSDNLNAFIFDGELTVFYAEVYFFWKRLLLNVLLPCT